MAPVDPASMQLGPCHMSCSQHATVSDEENSNNRNQNPNGDQHYHPPPQSCSRVFTDVLQQDLCFVLTDWVTGLALVHNARDRSTVMNLYRISVFLEVMDAVVSQRFTVLPPIESGGVAQGHGAGQEEEVADTGDVLCLDLCS